MSRPVERKVYAASIGAGAGLTVSEFLLWVADQLWWPAEADVVPLPVAGIVNLGVTVGLAFFGGWLAKHDPGYTTVIETDEEAVEVNQALDDDYSGIKFNPDREV